MYRSQITAYDATWQRHVHVYANPPSTSATRSVTATWRSIHLCVKSNFPLPSDLCLFIHAIIFVLMLNSESLKIFYLPNNISCWIPKWIDDVLHFRLTACLLVQVSQAIVNKVTSVNILFYQSA